MRRPDLPSWRRIGTPIALALVSLVAALVLWIAVTDAENPQKVETFRGAIQIEAVNVPEGLAVRSIAPAAVKVRVQADENDLERLSTDDFVARIDLTGVRETTNDAIVGVTKVGDEDFEVVDWSPELVTVTLEPIATKQVPVVPNLIGALPQGFTLPSVPEANPSVVQVSGATSLIAQVQAVSADLNLTGLRASLTQQAVLTARDSRGTDIPRVVIQPARAELRVTVAQQEVTTSVPVVATLQGNIAEGYNIGSVTVEPAVVSVSGTLEATQSLTSISTEPLDVSGLRSDFSRTARLRLPPGVQANRDSVNVRVRIIPAPAEMVVNVAPQVTGLSEGLTATFQTSSIAVRISGDAPVLRALAPGAIRAVVNASGLGEGVHIVEPLMNVPQGVTIMSIDPTQVVMVIRR